MAGSHRPNRAFPCLDPSFCSGGRQFGLHKTDDNKNNSQRLVVIFDQEGGKINTDSFVQLVDIKDIRLLADSFEYRFEIVIQYTLRHLI